MQKFCTILLLNTIFQNCFIFISTLENVYFLITFLVEIEYVY